MLPKIDVPIYELKLPSNGKEIRVRPFLVKEEKLLLIAAESKDEEEIIKTTKQVIQNCLIDDDIDVDKLPFFDIDFLIISLRAKSIGETVEVKFTCQAITEDEQICNQVFFADVDMSKAEVEYFEEPNFNIEITNNVTLKMKYPSYSIMKTLTEGENPTDRKIKIIVNCIDYVVDGDKVLSHKDFSKEELRTFVENLTEEQFSKLEKFIDNFPGFLVRLNSVCPKCSYNHNIEYRDFQNFFY
jgi:hypothetical protein